jgi:glucose-6-phosphate isomerase
MDLAANRRIRYAAIDICLVKKAKRSKSGQVQSADLFCREWWKQLYGESEVKGQRHLPASEIIPRICTTCQLSQQGERNIFETFLQIENTGYKLKLPKER